MRLLRLVPGEKPGRPSQPDRSDAELGAVWLIRSGDTVRFAQRKVGVDQDCVFFAFNKRRVCPESLWRRGHDLQMQVRFHFFLLRMFY